MCFERKGGPVPPALPPVCPACKGTGLVGPKVCMTCDGTGRDIHCCTCTCRGAGCDTCEGRGYIPRPGSVVPLVLLGAIVTGLYLLVYLGVI